MPPDDVPQAEGAEAQVAEAPIALEGATPQARHESFIAGMRERFPDEFSGEDDGEPQAAPPAGTGERPGDVAPTSPAAEAGEADSEDPAPVGDPEAFAKWLETRDAKRESDWQARLENQKRSMLGEVEAERRRNDHTALLTELDALDPEELAERIKTDRKAIEALATRVNSQDAAVQMAAARDVVTRQVPLMLAVGEEIEKAGGPSLRALLENAEGEEYQAMVKSPGGVFDWIRTHSFEAGQKAGEERFQKSSAYKTALEQAAQNAVRDAYGRMGGPPAREEARPPTTRLSPVEHTDPRKRAAARAAALTGIDFDPDELDEFASRRPRRAS